MRHRHRRLPAAAVDSVLGLCLYAAAPVPVREIVSVEPAMVMENVFKILVLTPLNSWFSLLVIALMLLISSVFFRHAGSGIGLYVYAAVTALLVVPFILFVIYVFLMADQTWTFSDALDMMLVSVVLTPLAAGWLIGMAYGGIHRSLRRPARQN